MKDSPVHARVIHLNDHHLRRTVERFHRGGKVLLRVVYAVHRPDQSPVTAAAKVDIGQPVQGVVLTVEQGLGFENGVVGNPAGRLVVIHQHMLDVTEVLARCSMAGGPPHRRKDVDMGIDDHYGPPTRHLKGICRYSLPDTGTRKSIANGPSFPRR